MFALFGELFSYSFLVRALIVGSLVALCAALLGVSLVLKRYSMIGDGLSHVGFGALSIAMAMNAAPLAVAIPVVIVAAFLLLRISQNSRLGGDSAIALISSGALAAGVLVTSLTSGLNADVYSYMFGSILAMSEGDVYLSLALAAVVLVLFIVFYNRIFAITFDESLPGQQARAFRVTTCCLPCSQRSRSSSACVLWAPCSSPASLSSLRLPPCACAARSGALSLPRLSSAYSASFWA